MGFYSWKYCNDARKRMIIGKQMDSYLLVPKEFTDTFGEYIHDSYYDGYGHISYIDIYEFVAVCNRKWISEHPEVILPSYSKRQKKLSDFKWYKVFSDLNVPIDEVSSLVGEYFELRQIGIDIACEDADNKAIKYGLKISNKPMKYEDCKNVSLSDDLQGCY